MGGLVSSNKAYGRNHLYVYCLLLSSVFLLFLPIYIITLHIFEATQQNNRFLLEHQLIRNIPWKMLSSVIIQNSFHTTLPLQCFAYTYLTHLALNPLFCALTLDL